jgi:hypothetical protein
MPEKRQARIARKKHSSISPEPAPKPRHKLVYLLAASDYTQSQPTEEREWIDAPWIGDEMPGRDSSDPQQ